MAVLTAASQSASTSVWRPAPADIPMHALIKLLHLAAAVLWLGGIGFMLLALRPAAAQQLQPPARLPLLAAAMGRFFVIVWASIAVLLLTGGAMLASVGMKAAPAGWHWMMGLGLLMCLLFAHLYFAPFRRLRQAVARADWPEGGRRAQQIALLARLNFIIGWLAIAAVTLLK